MKLHRVLLAGIALSLAVGTWAQAGPIQGSQALAATVDSPFGDVKTQTSFSLDPLVVFGAATGDFSGYPTPDSLGTTTLDRTSLSTFSFGNAAFGSFSTITGAEVAAPENTAIFLFTGTFTPGTFFVGKDPNVAQVLVTLTQVGGPGTAISFSGTLSIVPEPASVALAGIGLVSLGLVSAVRKRIRK